MISLEPSRSPIFTIMGAGGRVGGAAARKLRSLGFSVRALIHSDVAARELKAIGCETTITDVRDPERLISAIRGSEHVLAICPLKPQEDDAIGYHSQTINSLALALGHVRPDYVVAISDYGAHLTSDTGITTIFRELERRLKRLALPLTILRSAEHMENWGRVLPRTVEQGIFPLFYRPAGRQLPIVSAFDVGALAAELLRQPAPRPHEPRIVHIEGPERVTVSELARTVQELSQRPIQPFIIPEDGHLAALKKAGLNPSYADLVSRLYVAHNAGLIDAEPGVGLIRYGHSTVKEVFAAILKADPNFQNKDASKIPSIIS